MFQNNYRLTKSHLTRTVRFAKAFGGWCCSAPREAVIIALLFALLSTRQVEAQSSASLEQPVQAWSQMRGSNGSGVANPQAAPPVKIDLKRQSVWQIDLPGTGWSSPVYTDDLIWMTTAVPVPMSEQEIRRQLSGDPLANIKTLAKTVELRALAVSKTSGQLVHNRLLTSVSNPKPINPMNSYASPTPAIGQGRVICHFGSYGTWCLDAKSSELLWETQYVVKHSVGPGSSPMIFDGRVILVCDGTDQQFVVAVDLKTGKQIWKTKRPPIDQTNGEYRKAYSTPIQIDVKGKSQLVVPGAQWMAAYDPVDGKEIWRFNHGKGFSITPMPIYHDGVVIFSTGYMRPEFVAVDPTGTGDVTQTHLLWRTKGSSTMPSFVANAGRLFAISDKGIMVCIDIPTGQLLNRKRLGGNYSSSPLLAGGNLYFSSREGVMKVVKCSSDLEEVATNKFGSSIMASPILVGDDLLVRTEKKLIRLRRN